VAAVNRAKLTYRRGIIFSEEKIYAITILVEGRCALSQTRRLVRKQSTLHRLTGKPERSLMIHSSSAPFKVVTVIELVTANSILEKSEKLFRRFLLRLNHPQYQLKLYPLPLL